MANSPNHICQVCGSDYYACIGCNPSESWLRIACNPRHAQIYDICYKYARETYTKKQANEKLNDLKITTDEICTFIENIQAIINEIIQTSTRSTEEVEIQPTVTKKKTKQITVDNEE